MPLWHRYPWLDYAAVLTGVIGHASSEFVSVLTGLAGPENSVWRFTLGGTGLIVVALCLPDRRAREEEDMSDQAIPDEGSAHSGDPIRDMRSFRVLLAEDHPVNQELAETMLSKKGHAVVAVGNGQLALEAVSTQQFDIVLMKLALIKVSQLQLTLLARREDVFQEKHVKAAAIE